MKCATCGAAHPITMMGLNDDGEIETICRDCLYGPDEIIPLDPPLGWLGEYTKTMVMTDYATVQWDSKEN